MDQMPNFGFSRHNPKHLKALDTIIAMDAPGRWRASAEFLLKLNPSSYAEDDDGNIIKTMSLREQHRIVVQECAELRTELELAGNTMGLSDDKNSGRRYALRMPALMLQFIEILDPLVLSGTPHERKASLHKLMRTFPEYCVLTKI